MSVSHLSRPRRRRVHSMGQRPTVTSRSRIDESRFRRRRRPMSMRMPMHLSYQRRSGGRHSSRQRRGACRRRRVRRPHERAWRRRRRLRHSERDRFFLSLSITFFNSLPKMPRGWRPSEVVLAQRRNGRRVPYLILSAFRFIFEKKARTLGLGVDGAGLVGQGVGWPVGHTKSDGRSVGLRVGGSVGLGIGMRVGGGVGKELGGELGTAVGMAVAADVIVWPLSVITPVHIHEDRQVDRLSLGQALFLPLTIHLVLPPPPPLPPLLSLSDCSDPTRPDPTRPDRLSP